MSFSCSTRGFPLIRNYDDALRVWEKTKPWRNHWNDDIRPLASRAAKHKVILRMGDGSIALRLYNTDVLTYHPDGSLTVRGWPSMSTNSFANALLPSGLWASFSDGVTGCFLALADYPWQDPTGTTLIRCSQPVRLDYYDGRWRVHPDCTPEPWVYPKLDKAKARAALKYYRVTEFTQWLNAAVELGGIEIPAIAYCRPLGSAGVLERLREGSETWRQIANDVLGVNLKYTAYHAFDAVETITEPTITYAQLKSVKRALRTY